MITIYPFDPVIGRYWLQSMLAVDVLVGQVAGYAGIASAIATPASPVELSLSLAPTATVTGHIYDSSGMPYQMPALLWE